MANVERDVIKPPNEQLRGQGGDRRANGFASLAGHASQVKPPNERIGGDDRGGSFPTGKQKGDVRTPEHRFDVQDAKMPQPPSVLQPGTGAVPISPFMKGNSTSVPLRESAKG